MYSIEWARVFSRLSRGRSSPRAPAAGATAASPAARPRFKWMPAVSGTVWGLGLTSLLTDISSEMVASVLPIYVVLYLQMSPLAFGVVDGVYQGAAAIVRIAGGVLADRWRRHKEVAAFGYGLSAVCRLLLPAAQGAWGMITAVIMLDRIGKGIRTAPRDALISRRSPGSVLATAFGVHRAMDAAGAMLGPVLAFALLAWMPQRFDVLFVASFGVAILGLGAIALFVPAAVPGEREVVAVTESAEPIVHVRCPRCHTPDVPCAKSASLRTALQLLGEAKFRALVLCGGLLGLATISDSFIYLILQRRLGITVSVFPLLYVGTSLFTSLFAIPCGRLADRVGRTRVLLGGYALLALVYAGLLLPAGGGVLLLLAVVFALGVFYAATDGVLAAMAAAVLPMSQLGSGLAVLATVTSLARLAASVTYGFLWARGGIPQATACYLLALVPVVACAWFVLNRRNPHVT